MSDIVLKDKSGVKNTYSDVNAINIPDGKGGFVKYSLGSTLPYYDGTVVIERAESVIGLRKLNEIVEVVGSLACVLGESLSEDLLNEYGFDIEPIVEETADGTESITKLSCAYNVTFTVGEVETTMICVLAKVEENEQSNIFPIPVEELSGTNFNVLSTANSTVDEWLLANTEGVSE